MKHGLPVSIPPPPPGYEQRHARHHEPEELRLVGLDAFGRELRLASGAAEALFALRSISETQAIRLLLISGFRSIRRQTEIIRRKLDAGRSLEEILLENAYPGFSEHHTGRAIDFGSPDCGHLTEAFDQTREFAWLCDHAAKFGFTLSYPRANHHGIIYEPWHWCWAPPGQAAPADRTTG